MVQLFTVSSAQKVPNIKIAGGAFEEEKTTTANSSYDTFNLGNYLPLFRLNAKVMFEYRKKTDEFS